MMSAGAFAVSRSFCLFETSDILDEQLRPHVSSCTRTCGRIGWNLPKVRSSRCPSRQGQSIKVVLLGRQVTSTCTLRDSKVIHTRNRNTLPISRQGDMRQSSNSRRPVSSPAIKIDRSKAEKSVPDDIEDDSEDVCHVGCVREILTKQELEQALEAARRRNAVVVVDFYKTACGSCKYIEHGFAKLCRGEAEKQHPVIFLKHNVLDEYDEESELAEEFRIKVVPLFYFYRDGVLVAKFPTRDKEKILEAINKYSSVSYEHVSTDESVPKIPERNR